MSQQNHSHDCINLHFILAVFVPFHFVYAYTKSNCDDGLDVINNVINTAQYNLIIMKGRIEVKNEQKNPKKLK